MASRGVTAFGQTNTQQGWREKKLSGGILMDVQSNEVLLRDLPMPHSPRIFNGVLYLLLSVTGEVVAVDLKDGSYEVVNRVEGSVRGMTQYKDYLFVGSSLLRKTHTFGDLPLAQSNATFCGVSMFHLPSGAFVGQIKYVNSCEEIYDIQVLPGLRRPGILGVNSPMYRRALSIPNATFWGDGSEID